MILKIIAFPAAVYFLLIPPVQGQERWQAPAEADTLQNPFSPDQQEAITKGGDLYTMVCASCHGDRGDGTGAAGQSWDPPPADFTRDDIQNQSDGALFWKLSEGNPPAMISYKEILSDEERWQIITYLRKFRMEND